MDKESTGTEKKRIFNCGVTHEPCLHPDYKGTQCYTENCENIKFIDWNRKNTKEEACQKAGKKGKEVKR